MTRLAAVAALCLYVAEKGYAWLSKGPANPVIAAIFTLAFVISVRGTFAYKNRTTSATSVGNSPTDAQ